MTNDVKTMTLHDLIVADVNESLRYKYRDELKVRLNNPSLVGYLKAWDSGESAKNSRPLDHLIDDEPPTTHSEGPLAREIIASGFNFSTMRTPEIARAVVKATAAGDWSEILMSPAQRRCWRSVKSHYRKSRHAA